ncbi:MAG: hypothetical protein GX663_08450 [Clostridiales bacterium]|nr:hypothetical protein [Clostridiales bacterium]
MKYCDNCRVSVRGDLQHCPLCQSRLSGVSEEKACYPEVHTVYSQYRGFFRMLLFCTIVGGVAASAVNILLRQTGHWALYVLVGLAGFWFSLYYAVKQRKSLPQNITTQAIFISFLCVLFDFLAHWNGWSLSYAVPLIFTVAMLSMALLSKLTNIPANEYLICLILDIVFGFIPILFYALGLLYENIPSVICISCSIVCLSGIVLFQGKEIRQELTRRFHL